MAILSIQSARLGKKFPNISHLLWPCFIYLGLALSYLVIIPVGESPDEPGHINCLEQVSLLGRLPIVDPVPEGPEWFSRGRLISGRMCYHMPLYYLVGGSLQWLGMNVFNEPAVSYDFPETTDFPLSPVLFVQPGTASVWDRLRPLNLHLVRIFSVLIGWFLIVISYYLAQLIWADRVVSGLAAVFLAGWPQFLFMSRAISNDFLAAFLAVLVLYILLKGHRPHRYTLGSIVASLAVLTKISMYFTYGFIIYVFLFEAYIRKKPLAKRQYGWLAVSLMVMVATFGLIYFMPPMSDHLQRSQFWLSGIHPDALSLPYWQRVWELSVSSFWARFGWMNLPAPAWQNWIWLGSIGLTGCYGLIYSYRRLQEKSGDLLWHGLVWCGAVIVMYLQINVVVTQPQFRFLLPMVPLIGGFAAAGLVALLRKFNAPLVLVRSLPYSVGLILIIVNIWLVNTILIPVY